MPTPKVLIKVVRCMDMLYGNPAPVWLLKTPTWIDLMPWGCTNNAASTLLVVSNCILGLSDSNGD